jgi:hypothetical protein
MLITDQNLPKFEPDIYNRIAMNDLVTYAVFFLSQSGREINTEDIVATCFLLFPKRFQLRTYPQWPDSEVVSKRWVDCRHRGLILGKTATGFSLTPTGLKLAEKVSEQLTGQRPHFNRPGSNKVSGETRTRAGRFVKSLEHSDAFKLYSSEQEQAKISEFDFRSMLLCTMESSAVTLSKNLEQFKQYVAVYERNDLISFLDFCARKFAHLLTESPGQKKNYWGCLKRRKMALGSSNILSLR